MDKYRAYIETYFEDGNNTAETRLGYIELQKLKAMEEIARKLESILIALQAR